MLLHVLYTIAVFIITIVMIIALPFAIMTGFVVALIVIIYLLIKDYNSNQ
jgi:hypothetical protein